MKWYAVAFQVQLAVLAVLLAACGVWLALGGLPPIPKWPWVATLARLVGWFSPLVFGWLAVRLLQGLLSPDRRKPFVNPPNRVSSGGGIMLGLLFVATGFFEAGALEWRVVFFTLGVWLSFFSWCALRWTRDVQEAE